VSALALAGCSSSSSSTTSTSTTAPVPTATIPTADRSPAGKATVQYVLATYSTGKEVQSSWTSQPFTFKLDATPEAVITGWDKGVVGMQAGGRRELIIPPSLGYGDQSPGAGVAANDTLVFIVDLLKIN
jgi:FKBP-type peptidyl-prolyl cis-trans isomerase